VSTCFFSSRATTHYSPLTTHQITPDRVAPILPYAAGKSSKFCPGDLPIDSRASTAGSHRLTGSLMTTLEAGIHQLHGAYLFSPAAEAGVEKDTA
jgi:hypothetical protein